MFPPYPRRLSRIEFTCTGAFQRELLLGKPTNKDVFIHALAIETLGDTDITFSLCTSQSEYYAGAVYAERLVTSGKPTFLILDIVWPLSSDIYIGVLNTTAATFMGVSLYGFLINPDE